VVGWIQVQDAHRGEPASPVKKYDNIKRPLRECVDANGMAVVIDEHFSPPQ